MKHLALKVDVDTLRGTREGVPRLVELLQRHGAGATFLFSLGPDHTGRAITSRLPPGLPEEGLAAPRSWSTTGSSTLLYGTLLPGARHRPPLCADSCAAWREHGFEVGIHTWDHVRWQDHVQGRDAAWTRREMEQAVARFGEIFGVPPRTHGAAGWQMNAHAYRLTQRNSVSTTAPTRAAPRRFVPVDRRRDRPPARSSPRPCRRWTS